MTTEIYRYQFSSEVPFEEIESTLLLAILTTESLHGESQVRLDAAHTTDAVKRACVIGCEKTNRKAFLMELDPLYCDVIVQRWEQYTGQKAKRNPRKSRKKKSA